MKQIILYLALVVISSVASLDPGLRRLFGISLFPGRDCFYDTPRTIDEAIAQNWTKTSRPPSPYPTLAMFCDQYTFCTLYDPETKYIAGFQIALPLNEVTSAAFSWDEQGYIRWNPSDSSGEYVTKQVYLISEKTLSKSVEERKNAALTKEVVQEESIWVTDSDQQLMEIPTNIKGIEDVGFTKQACVPLMGQHYYYRMSSKTICTAKTLLSWFPLCNNGKLIGIGFVAIAALKKNTGEKTVFETPPRLATKFIVPHGPECLYDLAGDPTLTTMHVYFVDQPWTIKCNPFGWLW